jgi:hypothetical protein
LIIGPFFQGVPPSVAANASGPHVLLGASILAARGPNNSMSGLETPIALENEADVTPLQMFRGVDCCSKLPAMGLQGVLLHHGAFSHPQFSRTSTGWT